MQQVPQNRQGRQKTRKKPVLCEEKIVIFLKAFAQAASYFIFYYENTISLDVENLLLPMSCFFLGFFINMILIYRFHNQDAFTCFHIVLISLSLILAIESNSVDYDDSQKQIKMFMVLIYYACILIGRISFGNKHAALMMLMLIIVFTVYQVLLFSKIVDLLFMIAYLLFDSYFIWKYLRLLDVLSNFQKELDSKQYQFQLQQCKENLRIQQQALKYGTSDFIFFTNLQQKEQNKLRFYQINKLFDKKFDIKYMNNIISRMKVNQISVILKIQNKIYKILTEESQDPSSKFEEFIDRISRERYNNIINQQNIGSAAQIINVDGQNQQNNNQQSSENEDDQQQSVQEQDKMVNQRQNRFNFDKRNQQLYKMNGLEDQFWYIDSLKKCIQTIKAHTQDSNYNVQQKQLVKCFNLQEIILVLLYRIRFKYLKKSTTDIVTNLFKTTLSNVEIQHENTFYTANLFKCMYKSEWSLFLSMNKKQSFNTSDTTSNTNTDEATQRLLQFFKNRTEKFSRCITSLLCKFGNQKNIFNFKRQFQLTEPAISNFLNQILFYHKINVLFQKNKRVVLLGFDSF